MQQYNSDAEFLHSEASIKAHSVQFKPLSGRVLDDYRNKSGTKSAKFCRQNGHTCPMSGVSV